MDKLILNIDCCHQKISEKPISKISSSAIYLSYDYIQSAPQLEKNPLIIGIPYKGDLGLILSAGLLKKFFTEDYLLHSDEHFKKLHLKDGDRIKIFGMLTSWLPSRSHKNGCIKLKQTSDGPYGEKIPSFISIDIKNEWLRYIEKVEGKTKRIINFHTFYDKLKENRVQRTALDDFLEYNENGFGIPSQVLYSKIIFVSGKGRKAKTIEKLKESYVYGDSLYNLLVKNEGLEVVPDLKNFIDCFDPDLAEKIQNFSRYARKIFELVPEYDSSELLDLLLLSDIHSETFAARLEEFESFIEDNEYVIVQNHLNELKRTFPKKQKKIPENLKCVIIDDSNIFCEYQNTIQGFLDRNIPIIVIKSLSDDFISVSLSEKAYRFYFSKNKIRCLIKDLETEVYDKEILNKNKNYLNQIFRVEVFDDQSFEDLIARLSNFFFSVEGFEELKTAYWKVVYPVSFLYKNSPQSNFSDYKTVLLPFLQVFNQVRTQLPSKVFELIDLLSSYDCKNYKKIEKSDNGFNQIITISNQSFCYNFQKCLIKTNRLKDSYKSITFTGIPYKEYHQNNIVKAICDYCIPEIKLILFNREYYTIKTRIKQHLTQHYFEDNAPFFQGFHQDYFLLKTQIEEEISNLFPGKDMISDDVEIDLVNDDLHQKFFAAKREHFISKPDEEHIADCVVLYFSNEEWMFVPKDSKHYIASEEEDELITISKLPTSQIKKNDLVILYNLDVSQLTFLASNNRPLQDSLGKLLTWRNIIQEYLQERSFEELRVELENARTEDERKANPSIQNLRNWCNDEDLVAPMKDNLSLILRFANIRVKLDEIYQARKDVIAFRNSVRREIRNKLKTKLPKILLEKNPNSEFKIKIFGLNVKFKTREVSFVDQEVRTVSYHHIKKLIRD